MELKNIFNAKKEKRNSRNDFQEITYPKEIQKIEKADKKIQNKLKEVAKKEKNYDVSSNEYHLFERLLNTEYRQYVIDCINFGEAGLQSYLNEFQKNKYDNENEANKIDKGFECKISDLQEDEKEKLINEEKKRTTEEEELICEIRNAETGLNNLMDDKTGKAKQMNIDPNTTSLKIVDKKYVPYLIFLSCFDFASNFTLFNSLGDSLPITIVLSVGITGSLIFTSHYGGMSLKSDNFYKEVKTKWLTLIMSGFSLIMCFLIGIGRINSLTQDAMVHIDKSSLYFFFLLNLFLFGVAFMVSYFLHYHNIDAAKEFNKLCKLIESVKTSIKAKKQAIHDLNSKYQERINDIKKEYKERVQKLRAEYTTQSRSILELADKANKIISYTNKRRIRILSLYESAVYEFRRLLVYYRTDNKTPNCVKNEILPISIPEDKLKLINPFDEKLLELKKENIPLFETENGDDQGTEKNNSGNWKISGSIIILLLLFLSGCSKGVRTDIVLLPDHTPGAYSTNCKIKSEKVLKLMGIDKDSGLLNFGTFSVCPVNDVSLNPFRSISIKEGKKWQSHLRREYSIEKFKQETDSLLEWGYSVTKEYKYSKIYQAVSKSIQRMKLGHSCRKILILQSDLMENSEIVSYYALFKNADIKINEVLEKFENYIKLPDMTDFIVIIVFQPTIETDTQMQKSYKIWKALFESKRAIVKLEPQL